MSVSILNDVMGPIMRGPSSSHTAGGYRIAVLLRALFGKEPERVEVAFDPGGSYAPTYRILGVDCAFAAALLGWELTDERYASALGAVAQAGIDLEFVVEPLEWADHPNAARVTMENAAGATMVGWARSIGGGLVEVTRVDDVPTLIDGKSWSTLVSLRDEALPAVREKATGALGDLVDEQITDEGVVRRFSSPRALDADALARVRAIPGVEAVRTASAVFAPLVGPRLFADAAEMVGVAKDRGLSLGETAILYERTLLDRSEADCVAEMGRRWQVMRLSVEEGLEDETVRMPLTDPSASLIMNGEGAGQLALGGATTRAGVRAMACMHTCNSRGVVCAAPTGGSAGVIPGALTTWVEEKAARSEAVVRALFAAGAIGMVFAERATFAAETAGCQVEIGAAGAMAAAAICDLAGGSPQQCADAAAIALQNTMGTVCDPVQGGCEIPCQTRNAAAAANAFLCADLILGGYRNPISLDETIDASYAVGKALPVELRCTALGGIAATPSAKGMTVRDRTGEA